MESVALTTSEPLTDVAPAALLRGTARGLEVIVDGRSAFSDISDAMTRRLDEAPGFFKGSDLRVQIEHGPLPAGCLAQLDALAVRYDLRIVEVTALKPEAKGRKGKAGKSAPALADADAVPLPSQLAAGSAPSPATAAAAVTATAADAMTAAATGIAAPAFEDEEPTSSKNKIVPLPTPTDLAEAVLLDADLDVALDAEPEAGTPESFEEPTQTAAPMRLAATPEVKLKNEPGTRVVIGPVRSGVILEHFGHLVIFGDINPGAEVRATGNIVVLGRLRGTAHAGIGQDVGFILALRLEPQQLRIGRQVARAADSDTPASEPELAYGTGDSIIVERYQGKLPRNLATSI